MKKTYSKILISLVSLFSILIIIASILTPKLGGTFLQDNPAIDNMVTEVNFIHYLLQFLLLLLFVGCILVIAQVYLYMQEDLYTQKFSTVTNSILVLCILALIGIIILSMYMNKLNLLSPLLFLVSITIFLLVSIMTSVFVLIRDKVKTKSNSLVDIEIT